jgi:hypothetical protein
MILKMAIYYYEPCICFHRKKPCICYGCKPTHSGGGHQPWEAVARGGGRPAVGGGDARRRPPIRGQRRRMEDADGSSTQGRPAAAHGGWLQRAVWPLTEISSCGERKCVERGVRAVTYSRFFGGIRFLGLRKKPTKYNIIFGGVF